MGMRVAVISDVHGNLAALERVLEAAQAEKPDEIWCLGDTVGYGAEPNECCTLVADAAKLCLVGNHDLGVLGKLELSTFSEEAAEAAAWTATILTDASRAFLASLEPTVETERATLAHGSPRDPVWEYLLSWEQAADAFERTVKDLILVGHSHVALHFSEPGHGRWGLAPEGTSVALDTRRLLNPGSVGQPRDGDPRAAWLLLNFDEGTASFRRTSYEISRTQAAIIDAGLPAGLAERLGTGE